MSYTYLNVSKRRRNNIYIYKRAFDDYSTTVYAANFASLNIFGFRYLFCET